LSAEYYGSDRYWALLWDKNRAVIGDNPNHIKPDMVLQISALPSFTPTELEGAKRRFGTWHNYPPYSQRGKKGRLRRALPSQNGEKLRR
jgi:hypothetical protein